MDLQITLITQNEKDFDEIQSDFKSVFRRFENMKFQITSELSERSQLVLIDEKVSSIEEICKSTNRKGRAIVFVTKDSETLPEALKNEWVDDVIVRPIRPLEFLGKLRMLQTVLMWDEVAKINSSFAEMLGQLKEDLKLSERLQQHFWPKKFPKMKGLKLDTRYMAGIASGGDYFDVIENPQKTKSSFILTNSSNYGLSRHFISIFMKMGLRIASLSGLETHEVAKVILDEVKVGLAEKDRLSFFFGQLAKNELKFEFVNMGHSVVFQKSAQGGFEKITKSSEPFKQHGETRGLKYESIQLTPQDEILVLSQGFVDGVGGVESALQVLNGSSKKHDPLNEFVFHIKSQFEDEDDLPGRDCTGIHIQIAKNVLRVAS